MAKSKIKMSGEVKQLGAESKRAMAASGLNGISYFEAARLPLREFLRAKSLQAISETMRAG